MRKKAKLTEPKYDGSPEKSSPAQGKEFRRTHTSVPENDAGADDEESSGDLARTITSRAITE